MSWQKCEDAPVTVSTQLYSAETLSRSFTWQALSFLRCEWPFLFTGVNGMRDQPFGDRRTTYVLRADGEVLLSYAEVLEVMGRRSAEPVIVLGLSNVFTFPPYRREGHASEMMHAVRELINTSDAQLAILFCEENLQPFYARHGWQVVAGGSIQAPGTAPATMARAGRALGSQLDTWLAAAPLILDSRW
jgi:predicted N-acetyltransferase YhbS